MSVLGGILLENEALNKALEILRPEDFYREAHRKIFTALIDLSEKGEPADLVTLTALLQQRENSKRSAAAPIWPLWSITSPPPPTSPTTAAWSKKRPSAAI